MRNERDNVTFRAEERIRARNIRVWGNGVEMRSRRIKTGYKKKVKTISFIRVKLVAVAIRVEWGN